MNDIVMNNSDTPTKKRGRGRPKKAASATSVKKKTPYKPVPGRKAGQPTRYLKEYDNKAYMLCLLGLKDKELANFFDIAESTLNMWKLRHPKFAESLKAGREDSDGYISNSLYQRAKGYSHKETKVFIVDGKPMSVEVTKHHPPDTTAAIFWLKNRHPDKWRDRREVVADVKTTDMSEEALNEKIRKLLGDD